MSLRNSVGRALVLIGLAIGLPAFHLRSGRWALGGVVLFGIGLLLIESRRRSDRDAVDDAGDLADATGLSYLGDQDSGHDHSGGHSGHHGDLTSIDFDD